MKTDFRPYVLNILAIFEIKLISKSQNHSIVKIYVAFGL